MTYKILNNLVSLEKYYFFTVNTNPAQSNGLYLFSSRLFSLLYNLHAIKINVHAEGMPATGANIIQIVQVINYIVY